MKMNLIAALIALILAANFTSIIELPFRLTEVRKMDGTKDTSVRNEKMMIFRKGENLAIRINDKEFTLANIEDMRGELNPHLHLIISAQRESGLKYDDLMRILAVVRGEGVNLVSCLVENN